MSSFGGMAELRVPPATFTVAGLKDSHALTTQRVTVRRGALDEQQIRRAADALPRLAVDSFCCVARPLKAGHSSGNRFRLAVRGLLTAAQPTEAVVSAVRQRHLARPAALAMPAVLSAHSVRGAGRSGRGAPQLRATPSIGHLLL